MTGSRPSPKSLQHALNIFFNDEVLTDFKCETCAEVKEVVIKRKFIKLPRVLILHLKRYQVREITTNVPTTNDQPAATDLFDSESTDNDKEEQKPKMTKKVTGYRSVKNDAVINIPKHLSMRSLLIDKAELAPPKPADKKLIKEFECKKRLPEPPRSIPSATISVPANPTSTNQPRKLIYTANQILPEDIKQPAKISVRSLHNKSPLMDRSNSRGATTTTPNTNKSVTTTTTPLGELDKNTLNSSNGKARVVDLFNKKPAVRRVLDVDKKFDDALPELSLEIDDPFLSSNSDRNKAKFNAKDFISAELADMSDEEQLRQVLEMSKNETTMRQVDGSADDENVDDFVEQQRKFKQRGELKIAFIRA
jgi:hypothetical protein